MGTEGPGPVTGGLSAPAGLNLAGTKETGARPVVGTVEAPARDVPGGADVAMRRGGIALVVNGGLTGALGLAYWIVAARLFGETEVGQNSSLVSAMLTVSGLAQLNFTRSLSSLIPAAGRTAARLVGRVYLLVSALSLAAGALLAALLPHISGRYSYLHPVTLAIPGFAIAVGLWSIFTIEDTVLAASRRAGVIPGENTFFGAAKLGLLFLFAAVHLGRLSIFVAWVLPLLVVVPAINLYAFRRALPAVPEIDPASTRAGERWVRWDFGGYMFWLMSTSPLPFLVLGFLGPVKAAGFYIPLTVATAIDVVTLNVGNAITAETTRSGGSLTRHSARFVVLYWLLVLVGSLAIVAVAPQVLVAFGHHYKSGSASVLRLLLLASAARAAMFLANAMARSHGRGTRIFVMQAVASVTILAVGLTTMPSLGTTGMAIGWLAGSAAAGLLSLLWSVPELLRAFRAGPQAATLATAD